MPRAKKKYNERLELGRSSDGTRIRKWIRADTKPELEALRRAAYRDAELQRGSSQTFGSYAQTWFHTYKTNRSLGTQYMYETILNKFKDIDGRQLSSITSMDLQEIINKNWELTRQCSIAKMTLKQIFDVAIRDKKFTGRNPAEDLELPKRKRKETRWITDEEMEKIQQCDFTDTERRYIDILRYTGMRPTEALALRWEDFDFDSKIIHVTRGIEYNYTESKIKGTKTGATRDIPLNHSLASALSLVRQPAGYVFPDVLKGFDRNEYAKFSGKIIRKIVRATGAKDIVIYSFRHTFATFLYYHGVRTGKISTKKAAQILGHSEEMFIRIYTHIDDSQESAQEIVDQL